MPKTQYTWGRTSSNPERWALGIIHNRRLVGICADVTLLDGVWVWQRWRTRGTAKAKRFQHEGGSATTRDEAMYAADSDLVTRRREVICA